MALVRFTALLLFGVGLVAAAAAGAGAAHEPATPMPPPLVGEALGNRGSSGTAMGHCNPAAVSTLGWDVSGAATGFFDLPGPYPGAFRQLGHTVIGPLTLDFEFPAGSLLSYASRFEIDSVVGQVSGITTLARGTDGSLGWCVPEQGVFSAIAHFRYRAIIRTDDWICQTTGTGAQAVNAKPGTSADVDVVFETADSMDCHAR